MTRLRRARPRPLAHGRRVCPRCARAYAPRGLTPLAGGLAGLFIGAAATYFDIPLANAPLRGYRFGRHVQTLAHLCLPCAIALYQPAPEPCESELGRRAFFGGASNAD